GPAEFARELCHLLGGRGGQGGHAGPSGCEGAKVRVCVTRAAAEYAAARSGAPPAATSCTAMLPSAEASEGPATTGSPASSAVRSHSTVLRDPPPTTRMLVRAEPVTRVISSIESA